MIGSLARSHGGPAAEDRADRPGHSGRPGSVPGLLPGGPIRRGHHAPGAAHRPPEKRPGRHGGLWLLGQAQLRIRLRGRAHEALSTAHGPSLSQRLQRFTNPLYAKGAFLCGRHLIHRKRSPFPSRRASAAGEGFWERTCLPLEGKGAHRRRGMRCSLCLRAYDGRAQRALFLHTVCIYTHMCPKKPENNLYLCIDKA